MLRKHGTLLLAFLALAGSVLLYGPLESQARKSGVVPQNTPKPTTLDELFVTRMTGAFRGIFINSLWMRAIAAEQNYEWDKLNTLYNRISILQSRYPEVWVSNTGNLAYQLTWDRSMPERNWGFVNASLNFGIKGVRYNPDDGQLPAVIAEVYRSKIGKTIRDRNCFELGNYYRQMLLEQRGEKYYEEEVKWLERAYSKKNCPDYVVIRLYSCYIQLRYRAIGAGDLALAEQYKGQLDQLLKSCKVRFERQYRYLQTMASKDMAVLATTIRRMAIDDLIYEEQTDEAKWPWINGALELAKERLNGYDPRLMEQYSYGELLLTVAIIYRVRIYPSEPFTEYMERDRPGEKCLVELRAYLQKAQKAFELAGQSAAEIYRDKNSAAIVQRQAASMTRVVKGYLTELERLEEEQQEIKKK
jgi:hypothetical protein